MQFNNKQKSLLLTFLISGTVVLSVFNLSIKKQNKLATESYYEMEPEKPLTEEEIKVLEALESLNNAKAETNKAVNETDRLNLLPKPINPLHLPKIIKDLNLNKTMTCLSNHQAIIMIFQI